MSRALLYDAFGGIDVLYLGNLPHLELAPGQVRIHTVTAALNPFDFKMRSGFIPGSAVFPHGVGNDFAGVVSEVTPEAQFFDGAPIRVGDHVLGFVDQTGVAEEIVVPASQIVSKPHELSWEVAGGLAVAGLTADACLSALEIYAVDVVGVSSAAGSVGQLFCQLAIAAGAQVIGSASSSNAEFLSGLGVIPVDYRKDLLEQIRVAAPSGLTKFQDNFGRPAIDMALSLGLPANQICSIVDHAAVAELGLASPGKYLRSASKLSVLAKRIAARELSLEVQSVFALGDFVSAFELLETRHGRGKVVITF
ncbi:MAG: hypothetical protein RI926_1209 [Actinomycetota bacterium]|jgi:NADPH:quinone reductase-like Zn-dependent oxidoreductase